MARKILLADDSVTAQNMGRKILADAGYEVITVNNGSAALKKIAEVKPDLVILDVYMPGYSGLEVCQRLKENPESSRVPVLLTVGKLEPFKPEEAQRVRAEGFIVKPFEASELLSTLSKLEDKVVPRAEPSKPGRFARAIASVEESNRGQIQPIDGGDENGWKNRISFPHEKTGPEEKDADDASIYNPVNRDLRTVVATASQRVEEKKEEKRLQEMAVEQSVDLGAVAPTGVPQDVTPEEVAAIAAAAAHIQVLQATLNEENASAESVSAEPSAAEAAAVPYTKPEAIQPAESHSAQDEAGYEAQDIPMTMAAASAAVPRWTAVSVALDADEANISLEQEMQKAYAAFVAEQTGAAEEKTSAAPAEGSAITAEPRSRHRQPRVQCMRHGLSRNLNRNPRASLRSNRRWWLRLIGTNLRRSRRSQRPRLLLCPRSQLRFRKRQVQSHKQNLGMQYLPPKPLKRCRWNLSSSQQLRNSPKRYLLRRWNWFKRLLRLRLKQLRRSRNRLLRRKRNLKRRKLRFRSTRSRRLSQTRTRQLRRNSISNRDRSNPRRMKRKA